MDDAALYELRIYDEFGDGKAVNFASIPSSPELSNFGQSPFHPGMCCQFRRGHYKVSSHMDDGNLTTVLHGGLFPSTQIAHLINTTRPAMDERDARWLETHNFRRRHWHEHYNTTYVPLQWSESLKAEAKIWADTLLDSCQFGMHHDPLRVYGENAAANSGSGSWG